LQQWGEQLLPIHIEIPTSDTSVIRSLWQTIVVSVSQVRQLDLPVYITSWVTELVLEYPLGHNEWDVQIIRLTEGYVKVYHPLEYCVKIIITSIRATWRRFAGILHLRIFRPLLPSKVMICVGIWFVVIF
jgi:hypothetical protein